jgi:demethylmenaquinone methyltransferase/2-methoxy-6-polyprenyl-1,4-benzoquinol methylase
MPKVADRFARVAAGYDRLNRILSLGLDVLWRRRALDCLLRDLAPDARAVRPSKVLDLATGTADVAIAAARRFPSARIEGIDLTPEMLEIGRRKVAAAGLAGRIRLSQGDAAALPFDDASFDTALCAFGFRNFPDRAASLAELARILSDGGRLAVLEFFRPRSALLGKATAGWLRCVSAACAPGVAGAYAYLRDSIAGTCTSAECAAEAAEAGFGLARERFFPPACTCLVLRKYGKL